jgi:acetyl-CoA acetyltransferase
LREIQAKKCLNDAKVDRLDAITVGAISSGLFSAREHLASIVSDYPGKRYTPVIRVESACASGGLLRIRSFFRRLFFIMET